MVYVIFEVVIKEDCMDKYLNLASGLKDKLMENKGLVSSERFISLVNEKKLLSFSTWESEEDVIRWRNQIDHRLSQSQGRDSIFESYTITVASKLRCYGNLCREETPTDSNEFFV